MFRNAFYPITIGETSFFQRSAKKILTDEEVSELIGHIAFNPTNGDLIPDTGGLRKLRWRLPGRGTRSGARVIYLFHDLNMPLYLLAVYPKNEKIDLTTDEKRELRHWAKTTIRRHVTRNRQLIGGI